MRHGDLVRFRFWRDSRWTYVLGVLIATEGDPEAWGEDVHKRRFLLPEGVVDVVVPDWHCEVVHGAG